MKLINRLPLRKSGLDWLPVEEQRYPPRLCQKEMAKIFCMPRGAKAIVYATISTKPPTTKHLQPAYIEIMTGVANLDLDIRYPIKGQDWIYTPTMLSLASYLENLRMEESLKYYALFETD